MEYCNRKKAKNTQAVYADKLIDRAVYDALAAVFSDGAFCAKAITDALKSLKDERAHAFVTSAFYGVLDYNVRLDKIIRALCDKRPSPNSVTVLKIGLYYISYADMPNYAAVNRTVELSKQISGVYDGFINAVLKRSIGFKPTFASGLEQFSYEHKTPEWLCKMLISDYGENKAAAILDAEIPNKTHIRPVKRADTDEFYAVARQYGCEITDHGCYCDKVALERFERGTYAVQSVSSIRAVKTYVSGIDGGKAVDLCAAPGGKSVLMYELGNFDITSCDIYQHKLELMRGYAKKLGAEIKVKLNDAAKRNAEFVNKFDLVVADCPCSGTGTIKAKPDILIRRKPSDLHDLCVLQEKILSNAAEYCMIGGTLCYSTCSILKCENEQTVERFLAKHDNFELCDECKLLPDVDKCDGFYIARFKRVK